MGSGDTLPVGPGLWGFIAAFVLALALWLLMRNMNGRMRRMAYRERERIEQEGGETSEPTSATGVTEAAAGSSREASPGVVPGDREADSR